MAYIFRESSSGIRRVQQLAYLGHMLPYLGDGLGQFVLGALEFLAPVRHLDRVNCIHPARIEWLEVLHVTSSMLVIKDSLYS
jgi:hypothetical protein